MMPMVCGSRSRCLFIMPNSTDKLKIISNKKVIDEMLMVSQ